MPVDIVRIPPAELEEARRPRKFVWLLSAIFVIGGGVMLALWLSPADRTARDVRFWLWTVIIPLLVYGVTLAARWYAYDQARLRIAAFNRQRKAAIERDTKIARRPLALLACAYVTALGTDNIAVRVKDGDSVLHFQPVRGIGKPCRHSSIIAQAPESLPKERRRTECDALPLTNDDLLELFGKLLKTLQSQLLALRLLVVLPVHLVVSGNEFPLDIADQWQLAWLSFGLGRYVLDESSKEAGTMALDAWLDETDRGRRERVALFVNVQLRDDPPEGSAEVATALLVAWPDLLPKIQMQATSWLHRPVRDLGAPDGTALNTALTWGCVENVNDAHVWVCGLDTSSRLGLSALQECQGKQMKTGSAAEAIGVADSATKLRSLSDISATLGEAGHASSWLACALAAEVASDSSVPQLVATRDSTGISFSVVRPESEQH